MKNILAKVHVEVSAPQHAEIVVALFVMVNVQQPAKMPAKDVRQVVVWFVVIATDLVLVLVGKLVEVLVKALVWARAQWDAITSSIPIKIYGKQRITQ